MSIFLWTLFVVAAIESFGAIVYLSRGDIPKRTPKTVGFNGIFWMVIGAWSLVLLVRQS